MSKEFDNSLYLFNSLGQEKQRFEPIEPGHVRMYHCGPTVYDRQHIGNLRAYVFADTLRRTLEYRDLNITQVINITDVGHLVSDDDFGEDKMSKGLRREGWEVSMENMIKLGKKFSRIFISDLEELGIKSPTTLPSASEHIKDDIEFIKKLEEKGFTYESEDGIYFDTSKLDDYGKLIGHDPRKDMQESQLEKTLQKRIPTDFALWKFENKKSLGWKSPWGEEGQTGYPGWHIECSVMSQKFLGETFDIHTGGIDHIPIHHTNEIAQSESVHGKPMARFWLHVNFLTLDNEKVSKSLGNVIYLKDLVERGVDPRAYRYFLLGAHYRSEITFTWNALESAQNAYKKLVRTLHNIKTEEAGEINNVYEEKFKSAVFDDLNTPQALAALWELIHDKSVSRADTYTTLLNFDNVLGLGLDNVQVDAIPNEIRELARQRKTARDEGNFEKADVLREQINSAGYNVNDTDGGFELEQK